MAIITNVRIKLKNITLLIAAPAKGFLPKASTLEPVIFPNEEKPITKDANIMAMASKYLKA